MPVLIDVTNHSWNINMVQGLFLEWEAVAICSIPLPSRARPNWLFWNETTSELFSMKSAYQLQVIQQSQAFGGECSRSGLGSKFWKFLWSLSLPPKVKNLLWRASMGILPTHELLWRRHLRKDGVCFYCLSEMESVEHVLWSCPATNDVWLQSGLKVQKRGRSVHSFFDLMECV